MQDTNANELFHMVADMIIFVLAISALVILVRTETDFTYKVANAMEHNTTMHQTNEEVSEYKGYTSSNETYYDGVVRGSCVISDIINMNKDTKIYIGGTYLNDMKYNGYDFLHYTRYVSTDQIEKMIYANEDYLREYEFDTNGNITKVTYLIQ